MTVADGLLPEEYQAVVAPALRAAADLAAARGDPYLYNDLAAMLTLRVLVRDLGDLYRDTFGALGQTSPPATFDAAPRAACIMVLHEYEIEPASVTAMSRALDRAFEQLGAAHVFGPERVHVQRAWDAYRADKPEAAYAQLRQAAAFTAHAIDTFEGQRSGNGEGQVS